MFFDLGTVPYRLGFLLLKSDFQFWIEVSNGYSIDYVLDKETYYKLYEILGLKNYNPNNKFSPRVFFEEFKDKIPTFPSVVTREQRRNIIPKAFTNLEESEKIYYYRMIDWDKTTVKKKRSIENLEKNKILLSRII